MNAYTLKKMVPRLVLAVIATNLSWYLCVVLVDISNALGGSISSIMISPFGSLDSNIISDLSGLQSAGITAGVLGAAAYVTLFSSWAIITPILLGGMIALLVGYLTLIFRQLLIVALTVLSPLIIALWVIPGTSKTAAKGVGLFIKLLLMYPIIMALLTSGRIFSAISNTSEGTLPKVIALIALFAPYFMIPMILKFVGGALAQIGGMINDRSRGMLDLKRKSAHEKAQMNRAATLGGRRFDDNKMFGLGKFGNKVGAYAGRPTMALAGVTKGRIGSSARGEYYLGMEKDRIEALQHLEQHGVKDHDVGNEMAVHWGTDKSARDRIAALRLQGRDDLANRLERVQHLTGERYQLAGADMANGFGKLDDRAFRAINDIYDDVKYDDDGNEISRKTSAFGRMRKQQAWGRLKEQGKGNGNFTTFAAQFDKESGQIKTYTNADGSINQDVADNLAVALQDAGPGILGQTKQYESLDEEGNTVFDTKTAHMEAVARVAAGDRSLIDQTKAFGEQGQALGKLSDLRASRPDLYEREVALRQRKAMEQLVMSTQTGAYSDANTKVAAERAIANHIGARDEKGNFIVGGTGGVMGPSTPAQALYQEVEHEMLTRGLRQQQVPGTDGVQVQTAPPVALDNIPGIPRATQGGGGRPPRPEGEDFS